MVGSIRFHDESDRHRLEKRVSLMASLLWGSGFSLMLLTGDPAAHPGFQQYFWLLPLLVFLQLAWPVLLGQVARYISLRLAGHSRINRFFYAIILGTLAGSLSEGAMLATLALADCLAAGTREFLVAQLSAALRTGLILALIPALMTSLITILIVSLLTHQPVTGAVPWSQWTDQHH